MKKKIIPIAMISILLITLFVQEGYAVQGDAGSASDPIVTKSYVDEQIASVLSSMNDLGSYSNNDNNNGNYNFSEEEFENLTNKIQAEVLANVEQQLLTDMQNIKPLHQPVQAFAGQTIIGGQGTEIILRSGEAITYSTVENGITNLTVGSNLDNGDAIVKDNLLIVPRNDGRGVTITTDHAWFMIRGDYEIIG